jgi:hypothetical protein
MNRRAIAVPAGFAAYLAAAATAEASGHHLPGICLLRAVTGVPCPGCGITRGILQLLAGDVRASWRMAPAASIVLAFFVAMAIVAVLEWRSVVGGQVANRVRLLADRVLLGALGAGWAVTMARTFWT